MSDQDKDKLLQQLKDALVAIRKLKTDLKEERDKQAEPVAVIGMALRFPGGANDAAGYWQLLKEGRDAITDIPANRFDAGALYDPEPGKQGHISVRQGGFVDQVDQFDGSFFDITPLELESTDPQQRFLLELTHEALEDAGQDVRSLVGSNTGVYVGISCNDYTARHFRSGDPDLVGPYAYTGAAVSANSGRISYMMGFQGPSVTVDTACSATLVTTHLATQALRNGECDMAVVGGANLILGPEMHLCFSALQALSPDGRCKTFDNSANGYVRSEGSAVIVLKRLRDAHRDGDCVYGVVRGSAINQDGRSNGFTAPSVAAQVQVIEKALQNARVSPEAVRYIEAHGTGTKIGDPIEVEALTKVFSKVRSKAEPLLVGSVKSNIGHLESTAGMASIIKSLLCLQHGEIPPSIHIKKPNELISWDHIPVRVVTNAVPLPENACIGISGFGITGTNGHLIISAAPEAAPIEQVIHRPEGLLILPLSARSGQALRALAAAYADLLDSSASDAADICAFASLRRAHFEDRISFTAATAGDLVEQLRAFSESSMEPSGTFDADDEVRTVFVFSGQGAQWAGMGLRIAEKSKVFRDTLEACNQAFRPFVEWDVFEELQKDETDTRLGEGDVMQPLLFAIGMATAAWWKEKGVSPDLVIGHSMGEIAAASTAGHISLDEAARIVCTRSRLMEAQAGKGVMGATDLTVEEAEDILKKFDGRLSVAVINSPSITVIGGEEGAMDELFVRLEGEGRFCRRVRMNVASHTAQMDPVLEPLRAQLSGLQPKAGPVSFFSTTLSEYVNGASLDASYWLKNVRQPVRFGEAIRAVSAEGPSVFIEIGPHSVLAAAMEENLIAEKTASTCAVVGSFYRDKDGWEELHRNYGRLYETGVDTDWKHIYSGIGGWVNLPKYPWQRERYWFDQKPEHGYSAIAAPGAGLSHNTSFFDVKWLPVGPGLRRAEGLKVLVVQGANTSVEVLCNRLHASQVEAEVTTPENLAAALEDNAFDKVVFVSPDSGDMDVSTDQAVRRGCAVLQNIVEQLAGQEAALCVITRDALQGTGSGINKTGALLWGMVRTLRNEHPELKAVNIDVHQWDDPLLTSLIEAEVGEIREFRSDMEQVLHPVLESETTPALPADTASKDDVCLVTGGTSGLGLAFAGYLARKGIGKIALVSRSGEKPETSEALEQMRAYGAEAAVFKADVSSAEDLETLVREVEDRLGRITGIVHGAGLLDDATILQLSPERYSRVARPKIDAVLALSTKFEHRELKRFIAFSSAAHLLGNPGQANYNAANFALDQYVAGMRANGWNATAVRWGNIGGIGMATADDKRGDRLRSMGLNPIPPARFDTYFDAVWASDQAFLTPLEADFGKWAVLQPSVREDAFFAEVLPAPVAATPVSEWSGTKDERTRRAKALVREQLSVITKIPAVRLREDDTFKSMGVDSMMALQLRNVLNERTGLQLPVSSIWAHPTIGKYADFMAGKLGDMEMVDQGPLSLRALKTLIRKSIAAVTKLPETKMDDEATFKSMGVDSMQALQIRNLIQTGSGLTLAVSTIWAHPTVAKYAQFLNGRNESIESSVTGSSEKPTAETLEREVDDLSLDDLMKELDDKSKEY